MYLVPPGRGLLIQSPTGPSRVLVGLMPQYLVVRIGTLNRSLNWEKLLNPPANCVGVHARGCVGTCNNPRTWATGNALRGADPLCPGFNCLSYLLRLPINTL